MVKFIRTSNNEIGKKIHWQSIRDSAFKSALEGSAFERIPKNFTVDTFSDVTLHALKYPKSKFIIDGPAYAHLLKSLEKSTNEDKEIFLERTLIFSRMTPW